MLESEAAIHGHQYAENDRFADSGVGIWQRKSIPPIPNTKEVWAESLFGSTWATSNGWLSIAAVRPMPRRK